MRNQSLSHLWRLLQITLLLLLVLTGALVLVPVFHQDHYSPIGRSKTIFNLEAQGNQLSLDLLEYLEHHKPADLLKMAQSGKELTARLDRYKNDLDADQLSVYSQLTEASQTLRESTVQIIAADNAELQDKAQLQDLQTQLKNAFDEMPQGSRRITSQIGTSARLIVEIDAQQSQLEQEALSKTAGLQKFSKAHEELNEILQSSQTHPEFAKVPTPLFFRPWSIALEIWTLCLGAAACIFALGGLLRRRFFRPLQDMVAATDAAATGDLSRQPDIWQQDEMGQLAKALNRLTSVLARSENLVYHLATLVDSSGDGIISQTLDGTILSWNKGAQRIYGYRAEEVKGQPITLLTPHEGAAQFIEILEKIRNGERVLPFEMIHEGKSGRTVHVFLRVACIYDSTKKVIGASLCAQDLNDTSSSSLRTFSKAHEAESPTSV